MEVPESIAQLREKIQAPRRSVDTWYGRHVMRFFSIYLTRFFIRWNWTPNQATLLSLVMGLGGACFFGVGLWGIGILGINLWYLVDHVDGEIARYTGKTSVTGYFFDTAVNFFVQPATFFAIGVGLGSPWGDAAGVIAAFGNLMLNMIPMCEDSIRLSICRKNGSLPVSTVPETQPNAVPGVMKRVFVFLHRVVTYPVFLLILTGSYLFFFVFRVMQMRTLMLVILVLYAGCVSLVWIAQLVHKILTRKLDRSF